MSEFNDSVEKLDRTMYLVAERGAACIPNFLEGRELFSIQGELEYAAFEDFEAWHQGSNVKEKYQRLDERKITEGTQLMLDMLGNHVTKFVHDFADEYPFLNEWTVNDIKVQKYGENSYITSHRDESKFRGVIAVLTVQGEANFEIRRTRFGQRLDSWVVGPGSLVLLRAPELYPTSKRLRPFHLVGGKIGEDDRISITFRYCQE